jgi:DNA repair protein RecO (recombination protein O)
MSTPSRGIVFKAIKYSDTSLIAKIYSESSGLQSYLIKGAYSRKSKFRAALFQPMTLVEFLATIKPNKDLHFLTEISVETPYNSIPFDMQKSAVVMFVSELLTKSIQEEEGNQQLFGFIHQSMQWLDLCRGRFVDFPLYFTLELSKYLGFFPKTAGNQTHDVFDLMNGAFSRQLPPHPHYIIPPQSSNLASLCKVSLEQLEELTFGNDARRQLLNTLMDYYQIHLSGFKGLKSLEVLRSVME